MRNILIVIGYLLALSGCATGVAREYAISTPSSPKTVKFVPLSVGVKNIIVPTYLQKRELSFMQGRTHIVFLKDALWAEEIDAALTERLIAYLQHRLKNPNVSHYPWETNHMPDMIVELRINRFIKDDSGVVLDARWRLHERKSDRIKGYRLRRIEPLKKNLPDQIATAMDRVFGVLEEEIAQSIEGGL